MTAYAIAHLHPAELNDEIITYMERIQATLDPFGGRFLVHGATVEIVEEPWPGTVVVIAFPDMDNARSWYASDAYQEILPLRTRNIEGTAILVPGVPPGYDILGTAATLAEQIVR
ncbi:DUF1330 domain-containing protein [Streptomyces sp. NPDC058001]|uniref:DUF1330 domain-containing protein n=1 Tax=Streptomyces sp. NPDC058001 TaxID=3346300 RepID=UPI0036F02B42